MPSGHTVGPTAWRSSAADRAVVFGSVSRTTRRAAQSIASRTTRYSSPHTLAVEILSLAVTRQRLVTSTGGSFAALFGTAATVRRQQVQDR